LVDNVNVTINIANVTIAPVSNVLILEGNVATIEQDVLVLESTLTLTTTDIQSIESTIITIEQDVANLESNVNSLIDSNIISVRGNIEVLEGNVSVIESNITTIEANVDYLLQNSEFIDANLTVTANGIVLEQNQISIISDGNVYMTITPTAVDITGGLTATSFSGNGSGLTNLNASNIDSGTVDVSRLPTASTTSQGVVQLSSATNSISTSTAATSNAVKAAYDLASAKVSKSGDTMTGGLVATSFSGNGSGLTNLNASNIDSGTVDVSRLPTASTTSQGVVQLSDSTSSTSTTIAATSSAVKAVYDLAVSSGGSGFVKNSSSLNFTLSTSVYTNFLQNPPTLQVGTYDVFCKAWISLRFSSITSDSDFASYRQNNGTAVCSVLEHRLSNSSGNGTSPYNARIESAYGSLNFLVSTDYQYFFYASQMLVTVTTAGTFSPACTAGNNTRVWNHGQVLDGFMIYHKVS